MKKLFLAALIVCLPLSAADTADIYWIDVEGGSSTLIVTQAGQTVLMDAGFAGFDGRDAGRIVKALKAAGQNKIDYFITSHFHGDHVGGLAELAKLVPIHAFLDHGDSVEQDSENGKKTWEAYLALAGDKRRAVMPGEEIALQGDAKLTIVAAHSRFISPMKGRIANALCADVEFMPEDTGENGKSTGYIFELGEFEFVNLGDLSRNFQYQLACPTNRLGEVDLMQVPHHGVRDDVSPQLMGALKPTVAVMSNGATKGAGEEAVEIVLQTEGLDDLWQLHRAVNNDEAHNTVEPLTANLGPTEGCDGRGIHARIHGDGSYTITNERNGYQKAYQSK